MAKNLKVLDVTWCCNLTSTPDLSNNTALERLILKGCSCLAHIHGSIGKLRRLKHLDLEGCSCLGGLPEEFGSLEDLEVISVEGNENHFHLPESITKMRALSVLKLQRVGITRIPDSIGRLVNLMSLSMRYCSGLKELPDSLGDLKSLVDLDLSYTELRALPNSVGRLVKLRSLNLESLDLYGTRIRVLPDVIGDLQSQVRLNLGRTKVSVLPNSVGRLAKLQYLHLWESKANELPDSLWDMFDLRELWLEDCKIRELHSCIGKLTKLESLGVGSSGFITETPKEIGSLPALRELELSLGGSCITELDEVSVSVPGVYDQDCSLEGLEVNIENSVGLMTHSSSGLNHIPQLPSTLYWLTLSCRDEAPDFSNLEHLGRIEFIRCSLPNNVDELEALLRELPMLTEISLSRCNKELVDFCCGLDNFRKLSIRSSERVLLDFPCSSHLRELSVGNCDELVEIRGLEKLESLTRVDIFVCGSLETVGNPSESTTLSHLVCPKLREMEGIDSLVFQWVGIAKCISLRNIDDLKKRCRSGYVDELGIENNTANHKSDGDFDV